MPNSPCNRTSPASFSSSTTASSSKCTWTQRTASISSLSAANPMRSRDRRSTRCAFPQRIPDRSGRAHRAGTLRLPGQEATHENAVWGIHVLFRILGGRAAVRARAVLLTPTTQPIQPAGILRCCGLGLEVRI
ncbi:hypothetical protein BV20DRAFT_732498 [Pilatotrama ljubarskyi]|nr:hypothetical protein BV20DRAFT_732498 [Pilatotrama ljubarskyi]